MLLEIIDCCGSAMILEEKKALKNNFFPGFGSKFFLGHFFTFTFVVDSLGFFTAILQVN
jgi:hypothetical protein